jgi:alpha-beta hydrolase superfamily lysophospholipase/SAM-dependent methyltransferase
MAAAAQGNRKAVERTFRTWDGVDLFYRAWLPSGKATRAVVLFHRGHEHSGRWQETIDLLALHDFAIFAWDARGHGRSPGERGYADSFGHFVRDADTFVRHLCAEYSLRIDDVAVIAHSVGAVIAATWVHDYAPPIRALVLGSPALRVKLYIPFALFFLRLQLMAVKKAFVKSYVKARMLTHDPAEAESYTRDPLIARAIAVNILIGMHDTATRIMADASAINVPTLMLVSGKDWVVKLPPQRELFQKISAPLKRIEEYPSFFHDLFHETERRNPVARAREFILRCFDAPPVLPSLASGERNRATYESLSRKLPALSPANLNWISQRMFLKTLGSLSEGIRLGWRFGFDSGESLDYVYRNRAGGTTPLGKLIDRIYLESPGWRGIRQRRVHLESLLREAIETLHADRKPVHVLDVATGGGRYVLETLRSVPSIPVSATLRDWSPTNVAAASALARELGLRDVTVERGDAFDRESLAALRPSPSIAIVSGLYELFPDNTAVARSLAGIHDVLARDGYLIYTNQPWHPQLEMIARVLDNREGKPWVMRCRSQAEMDELVRAAGFQKLDMRIDGDGIFSVSVARRL